MKKSIKTFYGSVALYRSYCHKCESYSIVMDGVLQCCDEPIEKPDEFRNKRMSESEKTRTAVTVAIKKRALLSQEYRCIYCEKDLRYEDGRKIHYDHFLPWSYDGNNAQDNIYASCSRCNLLKSAKIFNDLISAREYILEKRKEENDSNNETGSTGDS